MSSGDAAIRRGGVAGLPPGSQWVPIPDNGSVGSTWPACLKNTARRFPGNHSIIIQSSEGIRR
jgi:hypothetical protein